MTFQMVKFFLLRIKFLRGKFISAPKMSMNLSGQFGLENIRPTMDNSRCFRFVFVRCFLIDMSSIYFIKVSKMIKVDL